MFEITLMQMQIQIHRVRYGMALFVSVSLQHHTKINHGWPTRQLLVRYGMALFVSVSLQHHTMSPLHLMYIMDSKSSKHRLVKSGLYQLTSPQLIEMPSLARLPVTPVHFSCSESARSMKWNLAVRISKSVNISVVSHSFPSSGIWEQTGRKRRVSHSCFTKTLQLLW